MGHLQYKAFMEVIYVFRISKLVIYIMLNNLFIDYILFK
jgi:hypothetical protein